MARKKISSKTKKKVKRVSLRKQGFQFGKVKMVPIDMRVVYAAYE